MEARSPTSRRRFGACWVKTKVLKRRVDSPAKIANLEHIKRIEYIFRFDIAMYDIVAVQVSDAADHLPEVEGGEVLLEVVLLADLLEEAAVGG